MRKFIAAAAAILAIAAASPSFARDAMTATLEKAVEKPQSHVIGSVVWRCLGSACATTSDISGSDAKSACRKLMKATGAVTAFTSPKGAMSAAELATCNG